MTALSLADRRSLTTIERLAAQIIRQCGFLRQNMADHDTRDRCRFWAISAEAMHLLKAAELAERRWDRDWARERAAEVAS